jgi:hypothetical protein
MADDLIERIDGYVRKGGKLLVTGFTSIYDGAGAQSEKPGLESLGITGEYEIFQQSRSTYLVVSEEDKKAFGNEKFRDFSIMMMYSDFVKTKTLENAIGYLRLVPNTMFGPPEKCYFTEEEITDFPGVVVNSYGDGKSVFIPWQIGAQYDFKGNYTHRSLFMASLEHVLGVERYLETDATPLVEMTHLVNRDSTFEWIGLINHSGQIGASFRDQIPIHNTTLRIKPLKQVAQVHLLRSGKEVDFKEKDGWIELTVSELDDFEMVLFLYR